MHIGLHVKYPSVLSDFNEINFLDRFSKNDQISNFIKIRPVGAELFTADGQADRRTDMTKLKSLFVILRKRLITNGRYSPLGLYTEHYRLVHRTLQACTQNTTDLYTEHYSLVLMFKN